MVDVALLRRSTHQVESVSVTALAAVADMAVRSRAENCPNLMAFSSPFVALLNHNDENVDDDDEQHHHMGSSAVNCHGPRCGRVGGGQLAMQSGDADGGAMVTVHHRTSEDEDADQREDAANWNDEQHGETDDCYQIVKMTVAIEASASLLLIPI